MHQYNRSIIWFKNDLRLHDNETLIEAIKHSSHVMPIFIIDPRWSNSTIHGFRKTGKFRLKFIYESVKALKQKLQEIGSDLFIIEGMPEKVLPELIIKYKINAIFTKNEFGTDEQALQTKLNKLSAIFRTKIHEYCTQTLVDFSAINTAELSNIESFDSFCNQIQQNKIKLRPSYTAPNFINTLSLLENKGLAAFDNYIYTNLETDSRATFNFIGGEQKALERLQYFVWQKKTANFVLNKNKINGPDYSSKFSPWLAQGCLGVAYLYEQLQNFKYTNKDNGNCDLLINSLLWRDYFYLNFMLNGTKFYRQGGIYNRDLLCTKDYNSLNEWINGNTSDDYINALMNEIRNTGWMSRSGRKHVVNYLSKQLLVDWRLGAAYFESQLLDYDVCINYGNWAVSVGVGPDKQLLGNKLNFEAIKNEFDANMEHQNIWGSKVKAS
jgi:deoxyribodipyrimidine photo-lyase